MEKTIVLIKANSRKLELHVHLYRGNDKANLFNIRLANLLMSCRTHIKQTNMHVKLLTKYDSSFHNLLQNLEEKLNVKLFYFVL